MEYTFARQSLVFLYSIILGGCLWFVYRLFWLIRLYNKDKKALTVFLDVLFMLTVCFSTFLLSLGFLNGSIRFYMFLGEAIGFCTVEFTLGKLLLKIAVPVVNVLIWFCSKCKKLFKKIIKKVLKILYKVLYNIGRKISKFVIFFKKPKNKHKKRDLSSESDFSAEASESAESAVTNIKGNDYGSKKTRKLPK